MANTGDKYYLDKDGLEYLVKTYITGKTNSLPNNVLATKIEFIKLDTQNTRGLIYGYDDPAETDGEKSINIDISGVLTDNYISSGSISQWGVLTLNKKNYGDGESDEELIGTVDLKNGWVDPDTYVTISSMAEDYVTISSMSSHYITTVYASNTLISVTDMNEMTISTSVVNGLFPTN